MKFPLPKGWVWARCHDVIDVRDGTHDTPNKVESGIPMVTSKNLKPYGIDFDDVTYISEEDYEAIEKRSGVDDGDILFAMIGTIGNPVLVKKDRPFSIKNVALFKINEMKVHAPFFKFMLDSPVITQQLDANSRGGNQKFVSLSSLRNMQIPLPSLPEQKRIVAILDKADFIRRKRQEAVRMTEELLRSVFLDMFGDPVENTKKWSLMPIGSAIKAIETGWSANSEDRPREKDEWAVLKISSVTSGRFLPEEYKVVADGQINRELLTPKRGDLLFSRSNTRELVAATCLVEQDEPKLFLPDKLWKIIPDEEITCSAYLRYLLAHPRFREKLTKQATGTSGSMLNISQAKVRGIEMPVPPIKLQKQFADFVWRNYNIRNKLEAASQSSNTLFNSLLQRAFKGEL